MALEQKLNLRLSQKLVMTPSLQQAIKLLQMTRLELEGVLNQELVENPTLEDASLEEEPPEVDQEESAEPESDDTSKEAKEAAELASDEKAEAAEEQAEERDPMDDIDLDAYFNDYLDYKENPTRNTFEEREAVPLENTLSEQPDLYEYLSWQVQMAELPDLLREISEQIIGNLNEDGFLVASTEELQLLGASEEERERYSRELAQWQHVSELRDKAQEARALRSTGASLGHISSHQVPTYAPASARSETSSSYSISTAAAALETRGDLEPEESHPPEEPSSAPEIPGYPLSEVEAAIEYIQSLDPPGVGARNLRESLSSQLRQLGEEDSVAYTIVRDHWSQFLKRQLPSIAKKLGVPVKDLEEPVNVIKALETRPGRRYSNERTLYVEPDVEVVKVGDDYVVQLNDDGMPRLRVSAAYRKMLRQMKQEGREGEAQTYIKDKMRSAVWLIKSLDQRQRTIYKVATSIVKQQHGFFEKGIDYMRPMVLRDVAEDIEMHESTVSRVVSNKYIHTPRGLFPMKYFFHSGLDRNHGDDISSLTVKKKIKALIGEEDPKRPLSDSELTRRLERDGVKIARRTVAKYRDELGIPSSTDRKQIF